MLINTSIYTILNKRNLMSKKKYPTELEHSEWLKRQNYFLEEQNKNLKKKLLEAEEYINSLLNRLKLYQNK